MRLKNKIAPTKFIPGKLYKYNKFVMTNHVGSGDYILWRKDTGEGIHIPADTLLMFVEHTNGGYYNQEYWFLFNGIICGWKNNLATLAFVPAEEKEPEEATEQC